MTAIPLVFVGAGLGGVLRHLINVGVARLLGSDFPWWTLIINVTGSVVMGLIAGWLTFRTDAIWSQSARLFIMTGVLGGYTTFSAFSLDAVLLWERGASASALGYVLGSVVLSILGLVAGLQLVRSFT
ncbi:fluoride efflux transporter CrcB [Terrarubrum flagellatum]|uniref:fluoride efflux transporter CrcB n=1 Tax=Terrirubrum flagellatum TaxID=2895980 RepID=UPI003144F89D